MENTISQTEFAGTVPQQLSDTVYMWSESTSPFKRITVDTVNMDFTLTSSYLGDQNVLSAQNLPDENGAIGMAQGFFSQMNSFPQDIDSSKTKTTLYAIDNNVLVPATSISTTQVIRVDFYQQDRNKMAIYYPQAPFSTINALIASGNNGAQIVEAHYAGKQIDDNIRATYPIITAQEAYQRLQNGQAYIANYYDPSLVDPQSAFTSPPKLVNITDVELGYYLSDEIKQLYMMPIIVFTGDNGFTAYVSAVQDQYLNK